MRIKATKNIKGEAEPYQALAYAVILCAVRDFRGAEKMLRRIRRLMQCENGLNAMEIACFIQRMAFYERLQEDVATFLLSTVFARLCDLDGSELLDRLESEVAR